MKNLVVGLNYGIETDPTLAILREMFPEVVFSSEYSIDGTFTSGRSIYCNDYPTARELDHIRIVATAFLAGWRKGFLAGWRTNI